MSAFAQAPADPIASARAAFDREFATLRAREAAELERLSGQYRGALTRFWEVSRQAGALDAVLAVQKEQARFAASGRVLQSDIVDSPPELKRMQETCSHADLKIRVEYAKSKVALTDRFDAALERMQSQRAQEGRLEDALKIRFDRESVKLNDEYTTAKALSAEFVDTSSPLAYTRMKLLPKGEDELHFAGLNWKPMRVRFEVKGNTLSTMPEARLPGRYGLGPTGHGRGAAIFTNIGNVDWKDYAVEFEFCITGYDRKFVDASPRLAPVSGGARFYVVDARESRFDRGHSFYGFWLSGDSEWVLAVQGDQWLRRRPVQDFSFISTSSVGTRVLDRGSGLARDKKDGNHFRIEIMGKRISVFVDGTLVTKVEDDLMDREVGGIRLDHGGVGFEWAEEQMGWVRNFSIKPL